MSNEEIILDENLDGKPNSVENFNLASSGQRFGTYLIDVIAFYVLAIVLGGLAGLILAATDGGIMGSGMTVAIQLISWLGFFAYYILMEGSTGKTIGKYITGTAVVYANGEKPSYWSAFTRTLSRMVPFEAFTGFSSSGRMWHDKWTDTYVVKTR